MLKKVSRRVIRAGGERFAVVASRYNRRYVDGMLKAAQAAFEEAGAVVEVVRVPGAFEIPVAAGELARRGAAAGVVCLGVILQGETRHAELIAAAVSHGLVTIQVQYGLPVIHEVLLLDNEEQARARCLGGEHNRGAEAASTALEMAGLLRRMRGAGAGMDRRGKPAS